MGDRMWKGEEFEMKKDFYDNAANRNKAAKSSNCSRETSIVVVVLETGEAHIVASLSTRDDTQVIYIDPTTGALCYDGKLGHDLFFSEDEALGYITDGSRWLCKSKTYARAILGYSALGSFGLLLVATKLTATIPILPGGGCIYTVMESQWIKVQLQNPQPQSKGELKNIQELAELDIDGKHYFCETRDITRPFPSNTPLQNPDDEFVWNGWLSMPFKEIGLQQQCVVLLQGLAECREFGSSRQQEGIVALTARRSRLHPGTRYLARGLNACFSTGNEVECEQLVWLPKKAGQSIPFSTYIWRRGTIPIWWGADLKLTAAEAEIYVKDRDPYRGSLQYYQRLSRRYGSQKSDVTNTSNQKKSPLVPIVCINLLRNGEGKSEAILVQHFEESLNYIKSTGKLPYTRILLINYDWHATVKLKGEQQTIEGLWKLLKVPTVTVSFSEGDYLPSVQRLGDCKGVVICNEDVNGAFCLRSLQNGVIRFNCADSLDRTNAASYFGALQVFVEQCRRLGISLDSDFSFGYSSMNRFSEQSNYGGYTAPLPPGWEKRSDAVTGKTYYIDHNTRMTTWEHPCPDKPWKRFDMAFDEFKRSTILHPISLLAELFLLAGDIHATLYTGSKAMHSHILNIFSDDGGGKYKQFSAAQNVKITLQRRYKNVLVDSSRQKQLEMFLGMRLFKHLPSVPIRPLKVLSRPSGCFLKPIVSMFACENGGGSLLSFKRKDLIWVCPPAADVVELFIFLGEPCHVCQLLLTVSHGAEDSYFPGTVDVRTGTNLDGLKLVLEGVPIPRCSNGTNLSIPLAGSISSEDMAVTGAGARHHSQEKSHLSLLYDFEELEGELNFLTHVVALTFYPAVPGTPITLGQMEILGVSLPWMRILTDQGFGSKFIELLQKFETNSFLSSGTSAYKETTSINGNELARSQPSGLVSHPVDLLTGDFLFSPSANEPKTQCTTGNASSGTRGPIDFFGDSVTDHDDSKADSNLPIQDETPNDSNNIQRYINCFRSLCGPYMENKIGFVEAMKLEVERIHLNLSAAERDRALLSIGTDPATVDPNGLLDEAYMGRLSKVVNNLTFLAQAAFEDKTTASIGLEIMDVDVIDFWNIARIGETCCGSQCEIRAEIQPPACVPSGGPSRGDSPLFLVCSGCKRKVCKVCCAGKGATLLADYSREVASFNAYSSQSVGSGHGGQWEGLSTRQTGGSDIADGVICKLCCNEVILDALLVDYIRVLSSSRRKMRADNAAFKALDQVIGFSLSNSLSDSRRKTQQTFEANENWFNKLLNGMESLAEFPHASLLYMVETAAGSAPFLSLLAPVNSGPQNTYWRAPPRISSVEFVIVLGSLSDVSGVILLVSPCGYSSSDCPIVQVWASNKIDKEERSCIGKWDVQSLTASCPELCGPEKASRDDVPRHVKFPFRNPVRCRLIWITLSLRLHGSNSVSLEKQYDLLSLNENPFSDLGPRASFGGAVESDPCIHAKRILVMGMPLRKDLGPDNSIQGSDKINMKAWLDRSLQLNRFKVPIEAERLIENDCVLEQYLSPASPGLAGFRLDAFSAIKPRINHSPTLDSSMWDASLACIEDRNIKPAVLFIQVFALQEHNNMVTVGEYRLPEVRPGTPLYFDFPRPIQARRMSFKLLGDLAAFADDPTEQDDSEFRPSSQPTGLSLANRIKLYYYADPYELGKWASLSAV